MMEVPVLWEEGSRWHNDHWGRIYRGKEYNFPSMEIIVMFNCWTFSIGAAARG